MRITSDDYRKSFGIVDVTRTDPERALNLALEIRKFEIDLYWKRATYFWTFIAIALAGYVTVLDANIPRDKKADGLLAASCLGIVFSLAWYFVNRASKFWQENWEKHVDLLEDAVIGPLYKTVLSDEKLDFWRPWSAYPFSVSKINQILSMFVVLLFLLLAATTGWEYFRIGGPPDVFATMIVLLTLGAVLILCRKGRTLEGERRTISDRRVIKIV